MYCHLFLWFTVYSVRSTCHKNEKSHTSRNKFKIVSFQRFSTLLSWQLMQCMQYTYSCLINQLVQDVVFHLCERHVFTGEIFHKGKKKLRMVHHAIQCGNRSWSLAKLIHSLIHVLRDHLQLIQLGFKFLCRAHVNVSVKISVKSNDNLFE